MFSLLKNSLILRLFLFWLSIFGFHRLLFLFFNTYIFPINYPSSVIYAFIFGLRLDLSATCYLISIPILIWLVSQFAQLNIQKWIYYYHIVIIPVVILVDFSSIILYKEWGSTLNKRAIEYLALPFEAIANSSEYPLLLYFLIIILISAIEIFISKKILEITFTNTFSLKKKIVLLFLYPILIFIGMRGSILQMPLSESSAYYSNNTFCNKLAINKSWHLIYDLLKNDIDESKYQYYSPSFASKSIKVLTETSKESTNLLTIKRPNIIFIIVESFTYGAIDTIKFGDLCPNIKNIMKQGLFFENIYSSGFRSDQGIVSIFSGYPAQPEGSVIKNPDKYENLPSFNNILKKEGYSSQFLYGGESNFYNIKAFLLSQGIDDIIDKYNFSISDRKIKLGVTDKTLFDKMLIECNKISKPMFSSIFTQSTHPPFDTPIVGLKGSASREEKYAATMKYTDQQIGNFLLNASKEDWCKNTLFVIVADHGDKEFRNYDWISHERSHIPLLLFGNALNPIYKGIVIKKIGGQHDLTKTILSEMNLPNEDFIFSKNLLDTTKPGFGYWTYENYEGWITDSNKYIINLKDAESEKSNNNKNKSAEYYLSYVQSIFHYFSAKKRN